MVGTNTETHSGSLHREGETLKHTAVNGVSPSNPSLQSSGHPAEEEVKDCKNQTRWWTPG